VTKDFLTISRKSRFDRTFLWQMIFLRFHENHNQQTFLWHLIFLQFRENQNQQTFL
jgi:hypothetical protein